MLGPFLCSLIIEPPVARSIRSKKALGYSPFDEALGELNWILFF